MTKIAILFLSLLALMGAVSTSCGDAQSRFDNQKRERPEFWWEKIAFKEINERLEGTGLKKLRETNNSSSVEVRVWVGFDTSPLRGLVLTIDGTSSSALYLPGSINRQGEGWIPVQLSRPTNGWENLWPKLEEFHFLELPDATEIGMEHKYLDLTNVVVEINDHGKYRTYHLFGLDVPAEQDHEAVRNIKAICQTLSDEFQIDLLRWQPTTEDRQSR